MSGWAKLAGRLRKGVSLLAALLSLAACLPTRVSDLAPNMVRLNLQEASAPSEAEAFKEVLVVASKETLARGYTLFRFIDWSAGPPQVVQAGQPAAANFSVTVVMFRDGEQGLNPVFDARTIMKAQQTP